MKNFIYLLVIVLLTGGCTYKNEAIQLPAYKGEYSGETSKSNRAVYLRSVKDLRTDTKNIGYTIVGDKRDVSFYSDADFAGRYTTGLRYALDIAGYKVISTMDDADLILDVNIKKIEIIYDNKTFESNLKGNLEIEVLIEKAQKTTTLTLRPKASKWIAPSFDSKDIEPFLYTLFSDNINEIVGQLSHY